MEGYSIIQRKKKERESKRRRRRRMVMMRRRKLKMDRAPRWDFPSLIGAYVSLGIAFLLLCCSSLAFLADKFLALFGLSLPCPHFNAYLVQTPVTMISRVDTLASRRPPFYSDALTMDEEDDEEEEEGEEEEEEEPEEEEEEKVEGDEDGDQNLYISNQPYGAGEGEDPWNTPRSGYHSDAPQESVDQSDAETVEILRQALMKEKAARHALQNDLEKERTYAASAADEAVAMILRVQKEKAIVEMNAKQYRRMVEEKAAYDEDEKEILKEILITMEKEVYFLRKQLNPEADNCADEEEHYSEIQEKGVVSVDVYSSHAQQQQQSQTNLEIENLRQKLMVVNQGREQLNFAVQEMEEEDDGFQSQLLKEIGCQLQIIRRRFSAPTAPCKSRNRPKKKRRHGFPHLGVSGTS